ncbi:transcription elongation factor GreA [Colidextribacter sp. OB.20]|uniref:GreA/GreB family elongation factor n=1 Tax=Colidextribacter sp. OB.20 TaxID=2304568 RepID=UPI001370A106|nr:GreA/GreB family elongation factor [Colidextribacter sp. OB.20]NBI11178.1 transcription elongation factor GreA [Colidextribacter sp. OB.20]
MHNELTKIDLKKMQEELDYRRITLRPQLLEEVKVARGFGDLSENFEYKAAKQEKNKNESRIRYLENMIKTARVIEDHSDAGTVGLYDKVTIWLEEDQEEETWQVVTTVRQDVSHGLISKESPMGSALMGRRAGDRVCVQVNKDFSYYAVIRSIEKGSDDGSAELNRF